MNKTRRTFIKTIGSITGWSIFAPALVSAGEKVSGAFNLEIGVCTSVKDAKKIKKEGAAYIEVRVKGFLIPDKSDEDFAKNLKKAKSCPLPILRANSFLPSSLKCVGPEADHAAVLSYAEKAFQRAKQVGIKMIVFGSSGSRKIPGGFDRKEAEKQFVEVLKKMGPLAKANDVIVVIEPLRRREVNFINTVIEGARIVKKINHPNIQLLADIYHMLCNGEPPRNIHDAAKILGSGKIRHLHIAEKRGRTAPGTTDFDFLPYFQAVKDIGYKGLISIEGNWEGKKKRKRKKIATLDKAIKTMREQMARVK